MLASPRDSQGAFGTTHTHTHTHRVSSPHWGFHRFVFSLGVLLSLLASLPGEDLQGCVSPFSFSLSLAHSWPILLSFLKD